jgi:hypothetical protein
MDMLYTARETLTTHRITTTTPGHATPEENPNHQVSPQPKSTAQPPVDLGIR